MDKFRQLLAIRFSSSIVTVLASIIVLFLGGDSFIEYAILIFNGYTCILNWMEWSYADRRRLHIMYRIAFSVAVVSLGFVASSLIQDPVMSMSSILIMINAANIVMMTSNYQRFYKD